MEEEKEEKYLLKKWEVEQKEKEEKNAKGKKLY